MTSLESLKNELMLQKQAIESKGGIVIVAGTHPSPAEITAGIQSIPATATANLASFSLNNAPSQLDGQIKIDTTDVIEINSLDELDEKLN